MNTRVRASALHPPGQNAARLQRELSDQLDGVVDFADFCSFLLPASGTERAQVLVDLAQDLYDETLRVLEHRDHEG